MIRRNRPAGPGKNLIEKGVPVFLMGIPVIFLFLFFYFPVILAFFLPSSGDFSGDGPGLSVALGEILRSPYYRRVMGFTAGQAFLSTLGALLLGLPGGWILGRYRFPGRNFIRSLCSIPFVLPSILVVLGFVLFFGNQGVVNRFLMQVFHLTDPPLKILYSFKAIILAHSFYNFPVIMRSVAAACGGLSQNQQDSAKSLGAGNFRLFKTVTLPQLLPGILSGASLVFLFCFMSFALVLVLGGGPRYSTVEVEIYRLAKVTMDFPRAAALGFWSLCCSMLLLFISLVFQKKAAVPTGGSGLTEKPLAAVMKKPAGLLIGLYLILCLIVLIGPLISVILNSFQMKASRGSGALWTLRWYRELFFSGGPASRPVSLRAVGNSLYFAFFTVLAALPLACLAAFRSAGEKPGDRFRELFFLLPMGVSSVLLGLGYLRLMGLADISFRGSRLFILGAHTITAYPFATRSISAAVQNIPPSLIQAAASLGASPPRIFWSVRLPLIRGALLSGAAFAFSLSLGEINATILLAGPSEITIPLAMNGLIGSYNLYGACALGTILMLLCGCAFFVIDHFGETSR